MQEVDTSSSTTLDRVSAALNGVCAVGGALGLAGVAFIAAAHVHDTYAIDHVAGSWMALARAVNDGTLYPALHTATTWGGTRYMPVQFVVNAGLARITGEYVTSGKLISYVAAAALLALVYVSLRREQVRRGLAVGATALIGVAPLGLFAATSIHGDTLPVVLQIGAVLLAARGTRRAAAVAGILCALAFLTKLSAIWAPVAIAVWFWLHRRDLLTRFVGPLAATVGLGLAGFGVWSDGRLFENVFGLSFSGSSGVQAIVLDAPQRIADLLDVDAASVFTLIPVALFAIGIQLARREITLWSLSLLCSLGVLLVVQTDVGTSSNHLLDLVSLIVINACTLIREGERARLRPLAETALASAVVWGLFVGLALTIVPGAKVAAKSLLGREPGRYASRPGNAYLPHGATILSEDPTIPVVRGESPLVVDPFMLLRLGKRHPAWQHALEQQIAEHRFARIVLLKRLDLQDSWWSTTDFGQPVATAIARSYRLQVVVPGYWRGLWIYRPRR